MNTDKRMTVDEIAGSLSDEMTIGIGGWGSRRKPMALVRAILRSPVRNLTVVSYGGPDVGLLIAAGRVRRVVFGFVTLDSIPFDPWFSRAREGGSVEVTEYDEGMLGTALSAAAQRLPFLPTRAGLGSDVPRLTPSLRTVASPYDDGEELLAVPALRLDAALLHLNRADAHGNAQYLGPDPYFDELFALAADRCYVSVERVVPTAELTKTAPPQSLLLPRGRVTGVAETPHGAHFTSCAPDYARDEPFQRHYAESARDPDQWPAFADRFLTTTEPAYQREVTKWAEGRLAPTRRGEGVLQPTRAEVAVVACAELFRGDGEVVASPMGLVPSLGARLARLTFEPGLLLSDGEAFLVDADGVVEGWQPFRKVLDTVVPGGRRHVVMGANQLDRFGNQNISAIGEHAQPVKQLLGVRGGPGNTINHRTSYWVPRHLKRVFVPEVDVVSGVGYDRAAKIGARFHDVYRVVTNLGVLDFGGPGHAPRLLSTHPVVTVDEVLANTGFELDTSEVTETRLPTAEELRLIREVLDPNSLRDKELPS